MLTDKRERPGCGEVPGEVASESLRQSRQGAWCQDTSISHTKVSQRAVTKARLKPVWMSERVQLCRQARCPASAQGGDTEKGV